jgi:hypothetical protein
MKKFLTFVTMAILLGGFVFNANAQISMNGKKSNKGQTVVAKDLQVTGENWEKVLTDFEQAVEKCLTVYNAMQKKDGPVRYNPKDFNKYLNRAETLRDKLDKAKAELNRTQVDRFNKASKKLLQVYQK